MRMWRAALARALRLSAGTGSSTQLGSNGSRSRAMRMADAGPHGLDQAHAVQSVFAFHFVVAGAKRIELECAVTLGDGRLGGTAEVIRRARHLVPGVGIRFDALAHRAAQ